MVSMKKTLFLILVLSVSKVYAYNDCPHTKNWLSDCFCQVTGGIFYAPNYANMKNGIFHNPFAPYDGHGNKPREGQNGTSVQNSQKK